MAPTQLSLHCDWAFTHFASFLWLFEEVTGIHLPLSLLQCWVNCSWYSQENARRLLAAGSLPCNGKDASSNSLLFIETVVLRQNSGQVFIFYWKIQSNGNETLPHLWESWKYVWSRVGLELGMGILYITTSLANPFCNVNLKSLRLLLLEEASPWITSNLGSWPHCLCSLCVLGLFLLLKDYVNSTYMYPYWKILPNVWCVCLNLYLAEPYVHYYMHFWKQIGLITLMRCEHWWLLDQNRKNKATISQIAHQSPRSLVEKLQQDFWLF